MIGRDIVFVDPVVRSYELLSVTGGRHKGIDLDGLSSIDL